MNLDKCLLELQFKCIFPAVIKCKMPLSFLSSLIFLTEWAVKAANNFLACISFNCAFQHLKKHLMKWFELEVVKLAIKYARSWICQTSRMVWSHAVTLNKKDQRSVRGIYWSFLFFPLHCIIASEINSKLPFAKERNETKLVHFNDNFKVINAHVPLMVNFRAR